VGRSHWPAFSKHEAIIELRREAADLVKEAQSALEELKKHLELATDPSLNLASYASQLEQRIEELRQHHRNCDLRVAVSDKKCATVSSQLKKSRSDYRQLEERFEEAMRTDPDSVYRAYSSFDDIRRKKPRT